MKRVTWHKHCCPQCFRIWECGGEECLGMKGRFCPYGELCHLRSDGVWQVSPKYIRKSLGVGPLFDTQGVPTVSAYSMKDWMPNLDSEGLE